MEKTTVLFICTHNAARSQMAEGYLRGRYGDRYEVYSAGTEVTLVHPMAIRVMHEIGIDISGHRSKGLMEFFDQEIEIVVMVCDGAHAVCPFFPGGKKTVHQSFTDPSSAVGSEEERIQTFRNIRDEIAEWIDAQVQPGGALT